MADNLIEVCVPDLGGAASVDVIEVLVSVGDTVAVDDPLATLEGDKASMDIPSTSAGTVKSIAINVGDKVSEGSLVCTLEVEATQDNSSTDTDDNTTTESSEKQEKNTQQPTKKASQKAAKKEKKAVEKEEKAVETQQSQSLVHAGPAVRRLANDVGIDLSKITGTGEKGRILKSDVKAYVSKSVVAAETGGGVAGGGFSVLPAPQVDFSRYGETEKLSLSKIQKFSGANLHRNWVTIPHVTQFDEADITELEAFRKSQKDSAAKQGVKLTPLVFIMKAVVAALKAFPRFNSSLDPSGEHLILKKYFHIGVAVDTPNGLVVPVIRDVDQKGLYELANELGAISKKAREEGLSLADMQGGCFTISSLGGIGGTAFTPIINAPEVAILGVSRSSQKPVFKADGSMAPRLMLPLSLSYDHRVIDGADGARFIVYLSQRLADIRTLLL